MAIDHSLRDLFVSMQALNRADTEKSLKRSGPGGTSGGMEERMARLESDMEHVKKSLDRLIDVPTKLAVLEERVSHLPTKGWMVGSVATTLAVIAAMIAFGEKLQALVG